MAELMTMLLPPSVSDVSFFIPPSAVRLLIPAKVAKKIMTYSMLNLRAYPFHYSSNLCISSQGLFAITSTPAPHLGLENCPNQETASKNGNRKAYKTSCFISAPVTRYEILFVTVSR